MLKVLKVVDEEGQYVDAEGNRYTLIYGAYAIGPRAAEFEEFGDFDEALEHYGLVEYNAHINEPEESPNEPKEIPNEPEEEITIDEQETTEA